MKQPRVIPTLLLKNGGLYKGVKFDRHTYVGDPINAIKIFNEKEVDELVLLDISATANSRIDFSLLEEIAGEAFMPMAYGGGIRSYDDAQRILGLGFEKVVFNSAVWELPEVIGKVVESFGSQAVVISMDYARTLGGGARFFVRNGTKSVKASPAQFLDSVMSLNPGELLLQSIDRDGTMKGYDLGLLDLFKNLPVEVILGGGAGALEDFRSAVRAGATAVSAASLFVYQGPNRAVLISYPSQPQLNQLWSSPNE